MKANLECTTIRDVAYFINTSCLRASAGTSLEPLAEMLCSSDRYKVYLEDEEGRLCGVLQAKQIARKVLELSRQQADTEDMLPAISFALNAQTGSDLAEPPVTVHAGSLLKDVLALMDKNHIREIAVVDEAGCLVGTLEAKNILAHYLHAKAATNL